MRGTAFAALCAAGSLLAAPAAYPQSQTPSQSQAPAPQPGVSAPSAATLSDQKIDAVAAAVEHVASLEQNYRDQIAAAPSADRQRLLEEAHAVMTKAVTDQGLSVEEYGSIIQVAVNDPDLRQKILQRLPSKR